MAPFSQRRTQQKRFTVHDVVGKLSYLSLISYALNIFKMSLTQLLNESCFLYLL